MRTRNIFAVLLTVVSASFVGCSEEDGPMKWVDLRYDVPQDSYLIDKDGLETVTIRVKSSDPWEVAGSEDADWYSITPDKGGPDEIYTVTIKCFPNTSLDDRSDIIYVKSDYWTGKEFTLTQKGTAYLDFEAPEQISKEGDNVSISVLSNQDWKAEVTSGDSWLNITEGAMGNGDNSVVLHADENMGEQRTAQVTIYDRNGEAMHVVQVTQTGVILDPTLPENGNFYVLYHESQQIRIPVESNAVWTVAKKTPADEIWYDIEGSARYDGPGEIVVNVSEYAEGGGAAVREGTLVLSTAAEDGGFSLVKTIRFKQASPDANRTQASDGKVLDKNGLRSDDGIPAGKYTFYLSPFTASDCIYLYFFWQREGTSFAELRFWLNTSFAPMKTELSCMPYCNDVNKWQNNLLIPFDNTKQVKIALDIMESAPDDSGNTWIYSEWWLNDKKIAHATSDGIADKDGVSDTWKTKYSDTVGTGYFRIWANSGSATLDKWEYTAPVVWGE